jgi:hypothetical protein
MSNFCDFIFDFSFQGSTFENLIAVPTGRMYTFFSFVNTRITIEIYRGCYFRDK